MKPIDLNDMMIYLKVVECGSFTLAANNFNLPKSNISRKVSRLEEKLGVKLLERSTRSLHMTEIGKVYYQHCLRIQEELVSADHCIQAMSNVPAGTLRINCSVSIGQELLAYHLAEFKKHYPLINIELTLNNGRIDIVEDGFDLAIGAEESTDSNLISKKLIDVDMHLYASEQYLETSEAQGKPLSDIEDIKQHQCLYLNNIDEQKQWQLFDQSMSKFVAIEPSITVNDFFVLKTMAEQDLGVVLLPDYFVEPTMTNLVRVLPSIVGKSVNIYATYPSRKGITPKIRVFLDYISEQFSS